MSLVFGEVFKAFVAKRPVSVMTRGVLENLLDTERMDALFERTAEVQYTRDLLFSSVIDLMGQVVLGVQPSIHAAHQAQAEELGVSNQAVYDKLNNVETRVSAELVRDSAQQAAEVIRKLGATLPSWLDGYQVKVLDGNHLAATEHRIKELRSTWAAPLPGKILVVLNPELMLAESVFITEDGHASERTLFKDVLPTVSCDDLWIADRNFGTIGLMAGIIERGAGFIIRQHGTFKGELVGVPTHKKKAKTGITYEHALRMTDHNGTTHMLRRITVDLIKPTRDGDNEIHILTNLPADKASAKTVAELYAKRWSIETMFQELTQNLRCEVKTLGYPKAAIFAFCLALLAYHAVSIVQAALRAVHGREIIQKTVSGFYLSLELSQTYDGMMIAIPAPHWEMFRTRTPKQLAETLLALAVHVDLRRYKKHSRGPKKPPPKKSTYKNGGHCSTARLIATRE